MPLNAFIYTKKNQIDPRFKRKEGKHQTSS